MQCRRIRTVRIQCRFEDHEHIPFGPSRCIQWCVDFALEAELYSMCIHIQAICQNQIGIHHWVSSLNRVCQWTKESRMLLSCGAEGSIAVRLLSVFIVRQVCLLPAFDMMPCHRSSTIVLRRGPRKLSGLPFPSPLRVPDTSMHSRLSLQMHPCGTQVFR